MECTRRALRDLSFFFNEWHMTAVLFDHWPNVLGAFLGQVGLVGLCMYSVKELLRQWELDLTVVDSRFRSYGILGALFAEICNRLDVSGYSAHFQTALARPGTARFAGRFGFAVVSEKRIGDVAIWSFERKGTK
jgi:hypothetical protein